ncbi:Uncharacterized protein RDABS01_015912 [Bienertia sinuspersici]
MASFLGHHSLHTFLGSSNIPCSQSQTPKCLRNIVTYASLPARDTIIDFGKYKGRMLGTLPSTYLKWVSNNLRARDFEDWAKLADQVLDDPVYQDRIEWEYAEKLLKGDTLTANSKSEGVVAELLEISNRFGWDNEDKVGWSKIDYQLLGTSKGGKIPRVKKKSNEEMMKLRAERSDGGSSDVGVKERRVERRDRSKMKGRVKLNTSKDYSNAVEEEEEWSKYKNSKQSSDSDAGRVYNPFPGRETLLQKALNRRRIV